MKRNRKKKLAPRIFALDAMDGGETALHGWMADVIEDATARAKKNRLYKFKNDSSYFMYMK